MPNCYKRKRKSEIDIDHTKASFSQLQQIINENDTDIIFLQKPLFERSTDNIKVPSSISKDYNCFYNSCFNPEALIYAKKTLKCKLVIGRSGELFKSEDALCLKMNSLIHKKNKQFTDWKSNNSVESY